MESEVAQSCPTLCNPIDHTVHGILQARILEWVAFPSSRDIPNPGIEPKSPTLQADSLPAEPQGKPQNTGVGSQSLLQGIFPTQGSNSGLLYCRRILYQLSSQGSLRKCFPKPQPQNHLESFSQGRFPGPTLRVSDLEDLQGALGVSML